MKSYSLVLVSLVIHTCYAPPVVQNKNEELKDSEIADLDDFLEYPRYLKEVVNALESDLEFRKKLEKADENEIKSGKIAEELEFVSHHVRTRLDEIKRIELERLKQLTARKRELENGNSLDDPSHHHIDHSNPHTFEIEDLKKLIAKTSQDLAKADKKRKDEFKQYEMEKEYKKQEALNHTNGEDREKLEKEFKEKEEKHKKHEKLHEPGHKAQLEEVWEEQDQMQQDFDPKTFFMLHDIDGNGLWDQEEVKALFIRELDKMYQQGAPEDDMRERLEEMERMRESVFNEMDKNGDRFIDFHEFLQQTNTNDFKQDNGWQPLDEQKPFTDEELAEYIRQYHQANQIPQGYPHPGMQQVPPGGYQQVPPGAYQQVPQGGYHPSAVPPPGQQFYPGQVPQSPPQPIGGNYQPNQNPQYYQQQPQYQQGYNQQQQYQQPPQGQLVHPQIQHPQAQVHQQIHSQQPQQGQQPHPQQAAPQAPVAQNPQAFQNQQPQQVAQQVQQNQPPQQVAQQVHQNQPPQQVAQQVHQNQPPQQVAQEVQQNQPPHNSPINIQNAARGGQPQPQQQINPPVKQNVPPLASKV